MPAHRKYEINNLRTQEQTFELYDETFHCVPEAPGGLMKTLVSGIDYNAEGNEVYHASNIHRFIEMVLIEEREVPAKVDDVDPSDEHAVAVRANTATLMVTEKTDDMQRWQNLMADKNRPVPLGTLVDIVRDLSDYYNERPTGPSKR